METRLPRRQYRSCDQCRKGKRACDGRAPERLREVSTAHAGSNISPCSPCANCVKWRKDCTYNWLSATQPEPRRKKPRHNPGASETASTGGIDTMYQQPSNFFVPSLAEGSESSSFASDVSAQNSSLSSSQSGFPPDTLDGSSSELDTFARTSCTVPIFSSPFDDGARGIEGQSIPTFCRHNAYGWSADQKACQSCTRDLISIDYDDYLIKRLLKSDNSSTRYPGAPEDEHMGGLHPTSNDLAGRFERSALIKNMFRIYHDSMENALSCWLAEQNCPYSVVVAGNSPSHGSLRNPAETERAPNWTNRIFSRVLRLDHAFGTTRGQQLTAVEDKRASRALVSAIMAFASQWATQPSQRVGTFIYYFRN